MSQSSQFQHISNVFFPWKLPHTKTPFLYNDFLNGTWGLVALGIDVALCWANKKRILWFYFEERYSKEEWDEIPIKVFIDEVKMKEDKYIVENVCLIVIFIIFISLFVLEDFNTWPPQNCSIPSLYFTSEISEQLRQNYCLEFPLTLSKPQSYILTTLMWFTLVSTNLPAKS